jgi:NADH-quinone oxidoreductase subunit N
LPHAGPELWLAGFALAAAFIGAFAGARAFGLLTFLGAVSLAGAGLLAWSGRPLAPIEIFNGSLGVDGISAAAKVLIGFAAAATMILAADRFGKDGDKRFELPVLVTLSVLGMFVMVSAKDLITLYIGVELQSLAAYVLAAWNRDDARSSEAGLKYFVLGAIASGMLLYGASFVYGFTGSVRFDAIAAAAGEGAGVGVLFGLILMICALAFKMSAAPFHMWTPDVYEGAPTPITAFFAAAPKVAAVALMARLLYEPFLGMADQWRQVIIVLSAISMLLGSFAALMQTNLKRLMAYSSIANMGFALMALASGRAEEGVSAALLYLAFYLPATIGIFALIMSMRRDEAAGGGPAENIDDLAGLAQRRPLMAALFTMLLFSVAGIPPFVGFFGKFIVFREAIEGGLVPLAIIGGVAAVIAAAYYLRILSSIWFKPPALVLQPAGGVTLAMASGAALLTFPVLILALNAVSSWMQALIGPTL